jgi:hypothetical protein
MGMTMIFDPVLIHNSHPIVHPVKSWLAGAALPLFHRGNTIVILRSSIGVCQKHGYATYERVLWTIVKESPEVCLLADVGLIFYSPSG